MLRTIAQQQADKEKKLGVLKEAPVKKAKVAKPKAKKVIKRKKSNK